MTLDNYRTSCWANFDAGPIVSIHRDGWVGGAGSCLGMAMWKFLAMRYHSASMREYAHFHTTEVKKSPFWAHSLAYFCVRARLHPHFVLFLTCFLPTMRIQILSFESHPHICAYAHQSAWIRITRIRMAIPSPVCSLIQAHGSIKDSMYKAPLSYSQNLQVYMQKETVETNPKWHKTSPMEEKGLGKQWIGYTEVW